MKRLPIFAIFLGISLAIHSSPALAASAGQSCTKAGAKTVSASKGTKTNLICVKTGRKLLWTPETKSTATTSAPIISTKYIDQIDLADSTLHRISVNGGPTRSYFLHVPPTYSSSSPIPLMIALHGRTWTASNFRTLTQLDTQADVKNFIVAYPDGDGQQWNAGLCCSFSLVDDVALIAGMIDSISSSYTIDKTRVGVYGWSNGAMMAFRSACELSDRVTSIGVGAGSFVATTCKPTKSASVIEFHGTADPVLIVEGSGAYPSPVASAGKYASAAKCSVANPTTWTCPNGGEIKLFIQEGVEHYSQSWWAEMAAFFMSHPRT